MNRILLAWIGLTDLRVAEGEEKSSPGPIGSVIDVRSYERIELLSNLADEKDAAYLKWLGQRTATPIGVHKVKLSSPTDFGEIYRGVVRVIESLRGEVGESAEWTFHLSPGTPAMAAVWIILAKTRFPAELVETSVQAGVRTVSMPFDISAEFLPDLLRRPDREMERLSAGAPPADPAFEDIVHRSEVMRQMIELARRVAIRTVSILIEGESGTGKELLARAIHKASPRAAKPFIAVNCGAIPADLVESELFGHEKGAFTGAHQKRDGHFAKAHGGTIFLDEIGELPLEIQVKLLRVLQEGEVTPIGSSKPRKIDVRVISATNRTLIEEAARGNFREDLFYRLAVFILRLPPVREREGDIGPLIDHLLAELNGQGAQLGLDHKKLSSGARNLLLNHHWPGNVREMRNTLLRAAVLSSASRISEKEVRQAIFNAPSGNAERILHRPLGQGFKLQQVMEEVARHYLQRAVTEARGNKTEAAKLVGLANYQTLTNWLRKYGIEDGTHVA